MKHKLRLLEQLEKGMEMLKLAMFSCLLLFAVLLLFGAGASAKSIEDLFIVPSVRPTTGGPVVFQPQTGAGLETRRLDNSLNAIGRPRTSKPIVPYFVWPKYDAFSTRYFFAENLSEQNEAGVPVQTVSAKIEVRNNMPGSKNGNLGTVNSTFTFSTSTQVSEFSGKLLYRYDFENDGKPDSHFSSFNNINHSFSEAGKYLVKVEVLDGNGNVSSATTEITVVKNDKPHANFTIKQKEILTGTIIKFDTSGSFDNQYERSTLYYRFDWNGDGIYDTDYKNKIDWNHLFSQPGQFFVVMEVRDPEGLTSKSGLEILVREDRQPMAILNVEKLKNNQYSFDATASSDDGKLQYRYDFDYYGPNDIIFDTGFSYSAKRTVTFNRSGARKVRLQVIDEKGKIDETVVGLVI